MNVYKKKEKRLRNRNDQVHLRFFCIYLHWPDSFGLILKRTKLKLKKKILTSHNLFMLLLLLLASRFISFDNLFYNIEDTETHKINK